MMIPRTDPRRGRIWLRRDLLHEGYDDRAIVARVRSGELVRIRHGAYTEAETWKALDVGGRHALVARPVAAQAKTDVVLSHTSSLCLDEDAPTWGLCLDLVHVTRVDGRTGRSAAGVAQHRGVILPGDVVERDGVPAMGPTRAALEVTTVAGVEASMSVVSYLLHTRQTTAAALQTRYELIKQWPDTLTTDVVLRLSDARFESVAECRVFYLCFRERLPMPVPQYEIKDERGRVVARVDFAWPELGVFLEFDGKVKYERLLRPGQRASDVVVAEKAREELICRLTGWRCVRLVWADLDRPAQTAAMIGRALHPVRG